MTDDEASSAAGSPPALELDGVRKTFGSLTAVDGVDLTVESGELFCLLGPSGCGKSTTLRTVAGFESPEAGRVRIDGRDVTDTPPNQRPCSMVFQDWALFPNKTVRQNVTFGPKVAGADPATRRERANTVLSLVEMESQADAYPEQLSGGQKQRVALARSLALDPALLLLDEPLSNLDRKLREAMQLEIEQIQRELGTTMLYVTHDQDEAFTLADRIGIVDDGALVQVGPPAEVYTDPTNVFVESFLGSTNFVTCTATGETTAAGAGTADETTERVQLETPLGTPLFAPTETRLPNPGETVTVSLRPERLALSTATNDEEQSDEEPRSVVSADTAADGGQRTDTSSADGGQQTDVAPRDTASVRGPESGDDETGVVSSALAGLDARATVERRLHRGSRIRYELGVGETQLVTERRLDDRLGVGQGATVRVTCPATAINYFGEDGRRLR
jgi:spermidine/putrescine transport system ATP-binding protein